MVGSAVCPRFQKLKDDVKAFAEAVLSGEPAMTGWDGRQVLTIVVAAYRSAETHQPVNLPI